MVEGTAGNEGSPRKRGVPRTVEQIEADYAKKRAAAELREEKARVLDIATALIADVKARQDIDGVRLCARVAASLLAPPKMSDPSLTSADATGEPCDGCR